MRKILLLTVASSLLLLSSCKKENNATPDSQNNNPKPPSELTIESEPQIIAKLDGKDYWLTTEDNLVSERTGNGGSITFGINIIEHFFSSTFSKNSLPYESISVLLGTVATDTNTKKVSGNDFNLLFDQEAFSFSDTTVFISFRDENGVNWNTQNGIQVSTNSFSIEDSKPVFDGRKLLMKFSCTLYKSNDPFQSRIITDASMVAYFRYK
jgi:hypothetical protein